MSEEKVHTKDLCWSVGMIYDPRGLSGVSIVSSRVDRVLQMVSESTLVVSRTCGLGVRVYDARCMWARSGHMALYMKIRDTDVAKREDSWLGVDRRTRWSTMGGGL